MVECQSHLRRTLPRRALNGVEEAAPGAEAPSVPGSSHRLNITFPFSQIKLEEPSKELAELAALVFDLVGTMAEWVPEDRLEDLRARAQALRDTLR